MSTVDFLIHLRGLGVSIHAEGERLICRAGIEGTLTAELRARIAERKAEILDFLREARTAGQPEAAPIRPVPRGAEPLPASFAQRRLWFLDQLAPGNPFYGMPGYFRLTGRLDAAALERSLTEVARRHESLRTTFAAVDSEPVQVIAPPAPVSLPRADLRALPEAARQDEIRRIARAEGERPFDLERGPLLRALLLLAGEDEAVLYLNTHHIVSDGWSVGVLNGELAALYPAFAAGRPSPLPPLPVQYADFAVWQRRHLSGERLDELLAYWRRRLTGLPPLQLAADHPRPEVQSYRGAGIEHWLPPDLAASLRRLAQNRGATLFMVLLAGFQALLHRSTGQDDFAVGSPIANRNRREIEGLIGFFVNMLVLRARAGAETPFRELVDQVQETTLAAYAHQDLPFERLVEELAPERSTAHSPLFQVAFALQNAPGGLLRLGDLTLELADFGLRTTRFDLELHFWEDPRGLYGLFLYDADLFDEPTVRRLGRHFQTLLEGAAARPGARLSELPLLGEAEQHQILVEWNDRRAGYPRDETIHGMFAQAARRWPEAVALEYGERTLTYAALERRANALARTLVRHGAGPEVPVAVLAERGPDLIVALLAILQAGGAYLPLDPAFPPARLAWMLDDAGATLLLAGASFATAVRSLPPHRATVLDLEETLAAAGEAGPPPAGPAAGQTAAGQLAYVIYTSGSTGRPKGVAVTHRAVLRLVLGSDYVRIGPGDRVAQASTAAFDAATFEIWGALLSGARLVGLPREVLLSAPDLAAEIRRRRIQTLFLTTALFHQLTLQQGDLFAPLRELLFGGETADPAAVRRVLAAGPPGRLLHVYGPTESTTFATWHPVTEPPGAAAPPIGRPIANTHLRVLDPELQPVPAGVAGELCLGGDGLARGYLGRPDLTAERFVPDPWGEPGARLYRTGDLARLRPDGAVEHLGRLDHQVKLRGFRIELGEIESALLQHPSVTAAVALVREDAPGDRRLTAYVVPSPQAPAAEIEEETAMSHGNEQVERWSAVFDEHVYREAELGDGDPTFNIAGWKSTFTGEPLGAAAMRAWLDDRIERIQALAPRRILEIGCGTGMLLFRLAPGGERYLGTDVSRASLDYVERLLAERPRPATSARIELRRQAADDFTGIAPESVDAVLLNSVVQYFPSLDYLVEVLEKAFAALTPGGFVFLGDLRSRPLLETFHAALELYRAEPAALRRTLADRARLGRLRENELAVDPALFAALRERLPRLGGVEIHLQRGAHRNELTRFRYDVILHAAPAPAAPEGPWLEWEREGLGLDALRRQLERDRPAFLGVTGIPNARLDEERVALAWLAGGEGPRTAGELRRRLSGGATTAGGGVDPDALLGLAAELGYRTAAGWSDSGAEGRFDLVLVREPAAEVRPGMLLPLGRSGGARRPWSAYANEPLWGRRSRLLVPALRRHLEERLPEFMLPAAIVVLDRLPLTVNGKIDRAALPAPDGPGAARSGPPPRTALEKSIAEVWGEVLKVDRVSLEDNFFDLGGHSLLVAQVTDRLTRALGRKVAVVEMFEHPTVRALARHLAPEEEPRPLAAPRTIAATAAAADEPIAVIALAGRFPGAQDVEALWRNLCDGVESIAHFSEEELLASGVPRELIHLPGYVAAAGALAGIELFDAHFFGYNPREAETLDPQHRLVLECAWEALERAGHDPAGFPGRIGVWAGAGGIGTQIYALTHLAANPALLREVSPLQLVLGNERDFLATRVSYKLNLKGPSLTVQTACSTSLVATHLACEALRRGACDMALAGGVTVQVPQHVGYVYQPGMLLSPDGHCRAFDVDARGSISGNGAGLVVLRRLSDALADGDPIHAVIRGSAVNNDGAVKVGFTAPGIEGQAQVIADALAAAGVEPEEIGYVEAHGTGTELGDPIEVAALTRAFRTRTEKKGFCSLGSVKSNIGHLGAAAGVAGLIKACLALENRFIPPTLHVTEPNPEIPFAESPFRVATEGAVWENGAGPRRAGVSSFGLGGTNAHVVLEEAPAVEPSGPSRSWQLLTLAARGPASLDRATEELTRHLLAHPDLDLADVAFTLRVGRRAFEHRRMLVARDLPDAVAALQSRDPGRVLTEAVEPGDRSLAFLFPESPDWPAGLGVELYRGEPTFRAEIDRCAAGFLPLVGADLRPLFAAPAEGAPPKSLHRAALFAFELALARLWMEWGLSPASFLGHGVGEAVAACLSGSLSFDDALAEAVALPQAPPPAEDGRLTTALRELAADPERVLLEVGPGDALISLAHRWHNGAGAITLSSLPAGLEGDETRALLSVLGLLWCVGLDVDGRGLHRHERRRRVLLPTYRFERQRFWVEPGWRTPAALEKQEDLAAWFHRPVWTREAPPTAVVPEDDGAWLLFLDEAGLGSRLAARLVAQGREVIAVRAGAGFAQTEGAFTVRPAHRSDHEALLRALGAGRVRRVVHLWSYTEEEASAHSLLDLGFHSLLALAQAHGDAGGGGPLRIEIVSSDMQAVDGREPLAPEKATLLGPCRVLPQERREIACRSIDITRSSGATTEELVDALLAELAGAAEPPVVAWRRGARWVPSFEPVRLEGDGDGAVLREGGLPLLPGGVYLITGGFGGMGLTLAEHLSRTLGARLALVGRRPRALPALEAAGVEILPLAADVADRDAMEAAVRRTLERFGRLDGVFHAAGLPGAGIVQSKEREVAEAVLAPKVAGTRVLDEVLRSVGAEPDFVVLCSSLVAVFGGFGQVDYCAANAFLDAFAHLRRPWRTVSINWDSWREVGMAAGAAVPEDLREHVERALALAMTPAEGVEVVRRTLASPLRRALISTYDLKRRAAGLAEPAPAAPVRRATRRYKRPSLPTPFVPPRTPLEEGLAALWQEVLGIEEVGVHDDFFQLGGHSLLGAQLASRVRDAHGLELRMPDLFASPTVAALAEILEAPGNVAPAGPPLARVPREGPLPLSFAQQRLWFLDQLVPGNAFYNVPSFLRLRGPLDAGALGRALEAVVRRHEALRTTFPLAGGAPVQAIHPAAPVPLPVVDLGALPEALRDVEARGLVQAEAERPFDLEAGPLLRARLLRHGAAEHTLLLTLHHIVTDGWSMGVLHRELSVLYDGGSLPEPPVQYADFAAWQRSRLHGEILEAEIAHWRARLGDEALPLRLPLDRPRSAAARTFRGARSTVALPTRVADAFRALGQERGATLSMTLLAAFAALLHRVTGAEDVTAGSPHAGRDRTEIEGLIGFFVNMLVLRMDAAGDPPFTELLARVQRTALAAYAHQEVPFDKLVEELRPDRALSRNPLFDVVFALQNVPLEEPRLRGLEVATVDSGLGATRFDLEMHVWETAAGLLGVLYFDANLFDGTTVARLGEHFRHLLEGIAAEPGARLSRLPLLGEAERHQVAAEWNDTAPAHPPHTGIEPTIHGLFAEQAARTPEAPALLFGEERLSYAELDARAGALAGRLRDLNLAPETPVAVFLERSPGLIVVLLAVLQAGGCYLALDPEHPAERLRRVLDDAGTPFVITEARLAGRLPDGGARPVFLDETGDGSSSPAAWSSPGRLAYVSYTSGSTGRPKGVCVEHRSVVRLVRDNRFLSIGSGDVVLHHSPVAFDASTLEIWGPLLNGGCLAVCPPGRLSPRELAEVARTSGTTILWLTAGLFHALEAGDLALLGGVRHLLAGGDALAPDAVGRALAALPSTRLINGYGPTENTTFTSCHVFSREAGGAPVLVGRPIGATRVHILDPHLQPLPIGAWGELCAAGDGLARGYLGRPERTAASWVPDPAAVEPGGRLYRTGDLARFRADGTLELLGRIDRQVKIRGFRVEPGEVEAALASHPAVREAVVLPYEPAPGDRRLAAWVTLRALAAEAELRAHCAGLLPEAMVPARIVALERMPLTAQGKLDRRALPAPEGAAGAGTPYVAPRTPLEERIVALWAEVLRVERVGVHDDFFALGGHSLLATQLVSRLRDGFQVELPLRCLFEAPTPEKLAGIVEVFSSVRAARAASTTGGEIGREVVDF